MSWLFGSSKPGAGGPIPPGMIPPQPPGGGDDKDKGKSRSDAYSFDSAALERAAKAAQTLEKSGYKYFIMAFLIKSLNFNAV